MKRLGLVVGLGVEAGLFYYQALVAAARERNAALDLIMAHADVSTANGLVRGGNLDALADYLVSLIDSLSRAGCEIAAISAATPHICIDAVRSRVSIPVISIIDAASNAVGRSELRRFALLGTRRVIESDMYGAFTHFDVIRPTSDEIDTIDRIYTSLALSGTCTDEDRQQLMDLARTMYKRGGLQALIVAGTDLSPFFRDRGSDVPLFDVSQAHVDAIIAAAVSG